MNQAVLAAPGRVLVEQAPDPTPEPGEVIVEVHACGICGTDRAIFRGEYPINVPVVLGHEYSGVVVAVGEGVRSLSEGERVAVDPNVTCGACPYCRRVFPHLCANLVGLGIHRPGGFAQYAAVPAQNVYPIPDILPFESAAFAEPLACCVQGLNLAKVGLGDTVVILGGGPIGCMLLQLCRLAGAALIIVSEHRPARREIALELGADLVVEDDEAVRAAVSECTEDMGADVVFEAAGRAAAAELALALVRRGGTVMWFGAPPPEDDVTVSPFLVNDSEITIRGSYNNPFTHAPALRLLSTGRVRVDLLATHSVSIDHVPEALEGSGFRAAGKVLVMPQRPLASSSTDTPDRTVGNSEHEVNRA